MGTTGDGRRGRGWPIQDWTAGGVRVPRYNYNIYPAEMK